MDTINRLPKDKATTFGNIKLTVNDKVKTTSLMNAKVTVLTPDNVEGQAEIKSTNQVISDTKLQLKYGSLQDMIMTVLKSWKIL